jgi:hypothetical protein
MTKKREIVAAYAAAVALAGATEPRLHLATNDAAALAVELAASGFTFRHETAAVRAEAYLIAVASDEPSDLEAKLPWLLNIEAAARLFWDAFEGQPVDGVEIIRKR